MFALFPAAYPQRPTSNYYSDHDYAYLGRDYLRALAQQRAEERREAQSRAHLEAARRQRAYQERLAYEEAAAQRRNDFFLGRFDEDSDAIYIPRRQYSRRNEDVLSDVRIKRDQPSEDSMQHHGNHHSSKLHGPNQMNISQPSLSDAIAHLESQRDSQTCRSPRPSNQPDIREVAARKIQTSTRAFLLRLRALRAIADISQKFTEAQENFRLPDTLDFDVTSDTDAPSLLFTPRNAPLHGHEHALVKLLSALDAVDSHGEARVRETRKQLVNRIESALTDLDAKKEMRWKEMVANNSHCTESPANGGYNFVELIVSREPVDDPVVDLDLDTSLLDLCDEAEVEKQVLIPADDISEMDGRQ